MQRSPGAGLPPFPIQGIGDGEGIRIDLDDGTERRSLAIDLLDAEQVFPGNGASRLLSRVHPSLEFQDGDLVQLEGSDGCRDSPRPPEEVPSGRRRAPPRRLFPLHLRR